MLKVDRIEMVQKDISCNIIRKRMESEITGKRGESSG